MLFLISMYLYQVEKNSEFGILNILKPLKQKRFMSTRKKKRNKLIFKHAIRINNRQKNKQKKK